MNIHWTSLVIGLIAGWLIEWLIDYFYWRRGDDAVDVEALHNELDLGKRKIVELETALAGAREDSENWEAKYRALEEECGSMETRDAAVAVTALVIDDEQEKNDLTLIQGIGPKYARKLHNADIWSFAALAALSNEDLENVLRPESFQKVDYNSIRNQANTFATVRLPEIEGDNLQRIHGIGPEYDHRLRNADITTYEELAVTDPDDLAKIIKAPAWRAVPFDAWLAQARLAADGDMDGLHELQDHLFTGYGDNLLLIHGIGSQYNNALTKAGIVKFADLANSTPEQLTTIADDAGLHHANFEAWIEEAKQRVAHKQIPRTTRTYENAVMVSCPQDLELIDGVGVIYEQRLYNMGIGSYWEVAQLSDEFLTAVLEIQDFQDVNLDEMRSSAMQLAIETNSVNRVWDGTAPDDFEVIEGIGIVYERRLYNAGYCTYEALSQAMVANLEKVCKPPQGQNPGFSAWIDKAKLLAAAKGAMNE